MKRFCNYCLLLGVFMLVLPDGAFAMGHHHPDHYNSQLGTDGGTTGGSVKVPEPVSLSLMGLGAAGVGIFYALKRKK